MDKAAIPIRVSVPAAAGTRTLELATAWAEIEKITGSQYLRAASPQDAVDGVQPQKVAEPGTAEGLAQVLALANQSGLAVAPRGGGSKMSWGNPPRTLHLVISTRRLGRVLEHAWGDMTATVEAGCTISEFQRVLGEHGQRLALDPLWPDRATIGGVIATNDSGSLRVRFGALRDLIIGVTLALPDGTLARSGGKVVKNVAGYDLPKLATGSLGTLGIITQAIFRLHPVPREVRTFTFDGNVHDLNGFVLAVQDSRLAYTGLQLRAAHDGPALLDVRFAGIPAGLEAQERALLRLSGQARQVLPTSAVWRSGEELLPGSSTAVVGKFSVLPSHLARVCDLAAKLMVACGPYKLVAQGVGVGLLRLEGAAANLFDVVGAFRTEIARLGGSLVVLDCPPEMKARADVWGFAGDSLALMARVKQQFDPAGTLNPGRFVGGI